MVKLLTALIAVAAITFAVSAAFACGDSHMSNPPQPQVQTPPDGSSGT
jgi:hypothetical protein